MQKLVKFITIWLIESVFCRGFRGYKASHARSPCTATKLSKLLCDDMRVRNRKFTLKITSGIQSLKEY